MEALVVIGIVIWIFTQVSKSSSTNITTNDSSPSGGYAGPHHPTPPPTYETDEENWDDRYDREPEYERDDGALWDSESEGWRIADDVIERDGEYYIDEVKD